MKETFRAAMWWLVGYSNGKTGEELANPEQLDELYREDYERGQTTGREASNVSS